LQRGGDEKQEDGGIEEVDTLYEAQGCVYH